MTHQDNVPYKPYHHSTQSSQSQQQLLTIQRVKVYI